MESFIRRDAEFRRLYNCSFYNISIIPLEKRANVPIGALIFAVSFIEEEIFLCFYYKICLNERKFILNRFYTYHVRVRPCMYHVRNKMQPFVPNAHAFWRVYCAKQIAAICPKCASVWRVNYVPLLASTSKTEQKKRKKARNHRQIPLVHDPE